MAFEGTDDFSKLTDYNPTFRPDARRFEMVTLPFQDFYGMTESVRMLGEIGVPDIAQHTRALHEPVLKWAEQNDVRIVSPQDDAHRSAILSIAPPHPPEAYHPVQRAPTLPRLRGGVRGSRSYRAAPACRRLHGRDHLSGGARGADPHLQRTNYPETGKLQALGGPRAGRSGDVRHAALERRELQRRDEHVPGRCDGAEPHGAAARDAGRDYGERGEGVLLLRAERGVGDGNGERGESRRGRDVHGDEPTLLPLQRDLADGAGLGGADVAVDCAE